MAEWKASGLTAAEFTAGKGYAAATLKWWSSRFNTGDAVASSARRDEPRPSGVLSLVRLIPKEGAANAAVATPAETPVVLDFGRARLELRRGFDAETLRAVLGVLDARTGVGP